jgi:hypothetical protein
MNSHQLSGGTRYLKPFNPNVIVVINVVRTSVNSTDRVKNIYDVHALTGLASKYQINL